MVLSDKGSFQYRLHHEYFVPKQTTGEAVQ
jgi:hypothetical protein